MNDCQPQDASVADILFVVQNRPLTPNGTGGGSALSYSHLRLLAGTRNRIHLVLLEDESGKASFEQFKQDPADEWQEVQRLTASVHVIKDQRSTKRRSLLTRMRLLLTSPLSLSNAFSLETSQAFSQLLEQIDPCLIWAEHWPPALLAVSTPGAKPPIVYAHHDWASRIKPLKSSRSPSWRDRLRYGSLRRAERQMVREVAGCASGSVTDCAEFRALGAVAAYLPTTYEGVKWDDAADGTQPPRIVHLGGMQTTANRLGLERFMDVCWAPIVSGSNSPPELHIIGDLDGAPPSLLQKLKDAGATCSGFVDDLGSVLRPFDLHIIPWEFNTGTRTRLPVVFNYGQVLVSTQAGVAGASEIKDGQNCVLVDALPDMAAKILALLQAEPAVRKAMGERARKTFEESFTEAALKERMTNFLCEILLAGGPSEAGSDTHA